MQMPGAALRQSCNTCCGNPYCGYTHGHASLKAQRPNGIEPALHTRERAIGDRSRSRRPARERSIATRRGRPRPRQRDRG
jgi:hypothetical protein